MDNKKSMLAILGSPLKKGKVDSMYNYAIEEAEKKGWNVDKVNLYESNIEYCKGCFVCDKTGECVQKDDIQRIAESLKNCDVVLLAAPVYWANVPAAVKNMFDRLRGTVSKETSTFPQARLSKGKKYIYLTACNTPSPFSWICGQSRGAYRSVNEFFKTAGVKKGYKYVCANSYKKNGLDESFKNSISSYLNSIS